MLGLITLVFIGIYIGLFLFLSARAKTPRGRLLIRLALLAPLIWLSGNALVGYAWFRVACAREAKTTLIRSDLPSASVLRLEGSFNSELAAYGILKKFPSLVAVEALESKLGATTRPRHAMSRYERGPLTAKSRADATFELRELPLDIIGFPGNVPTIVTEGQTKADYVIRIEEAQRALRQTVTRARLLRADGTPLASSTDILYLWMDSDLVPFGAPSQDSSRCGMQTIVGSDRLISLIAR